MFCSLRNHMVLFSQRLTGSCCHPPTCRVWHNAALRFNCATFLSGLILSAVLLQRGKLRHKRQGRGLKGDWGNFVYISARCMPGNFARTEFELCESRLRLEKMFASAGSWPLVIWKALGLHREQFLFWKEKHMGSSEAISRAAGEDAKRKAATHSCNRVTVLPFSISHFGGRIKPAYGTQG